MSITRYTLLLLLTFVGFGCDESPPRTPSPNARITYAGFEWLNDADPRRDLGVALARGDKRFIQCMGIGPHTPGVHPSEPLVKQHGVRTLAGTTDVIESEAHNQALERASEYARKYNSLLLDALKNATADAQPGGPANGGQPLSPDSISTPSAAGPRR